MGSGQIEVLYARGIHSQYTYIFCQMNLCAYKHWQPYSCLYLCILLYAGYNYFYNQVSPKAYIP